MGLRFILVTIWLLPLMGGAALLYYDFSVSAASVPETNRAMRERMCREHMDLAKAEPENDTVRLAVRECLGSGYITQAEGITAID